MLFRFLPSVVLAAVFAIMFAGWLKRTKEHFKNNNLATVVTVVGSLILFLIPIALLAGLVTKQALVFADYFANDFDWSMISNLESIEVFGYTFEPGSIVADLKSLLTSTGQFIYNSLTNIGGGLAKLLFQLVVFVFLYFYFLRDKDKISKAIESVVPMSSSDIKTIKKQFVGVSETVFRGSIKVALISGLAGLIIFSLIGLPAPLIWALLAGLLSLIPTIGTFFVYLIAIIVAVFLVNPFVAIGALCFYLIVDVVIIQNVLKPKWIEDKFALHPVLTLSLIHI